MIVLVMTINTGKFSALTSFITTTATTINNDDTEALVVTKAISTEKINR